MTAERTADLTGSAKPADLFSVAHFPRLSGPPFGPPFAPPPGGAKKAPKKGPKTAQKVCQPKADLDKLG